MKIEPLEEASDCRAGENGSDNEVEEEGLDDEAQEEGYASKGEEHGSVGEESEKKDSREDKSSTESWNGSVRQETTVVPLESKHEVHITNQLNILQVEPADEDNEEINY